MKVLVTTILFPAYTARAIDPVTLISWRLQNGFLAGAAGKKIFVVALICLILPSARALDPTRAISQYAHTAWRNREGYFASAPSAIAQTKDGYIWIGTGAGLLRFDGVRYIRWSPPNGGQALPTSTIVSLFASRDGSLWIGTSWGLARWFNGTLTNYSDVTGHINSILEDQGGRVWIARTRVMDGKGPLCQVLVSKVRCYGKLDGISLAGASSMVIDSSGNFWVGGEGALTRWTPHSAQTFYPLNNQRNFHTQIDALVASRDRGLWVGFYGTGHGLGLQHFEQGAWHQETIGAFHGTSFQIPSLFIDSANSLWVGTESAGIYRIRDNVVQHFDTSDGLSGDDVQGIFEDAEHSLWVITPSGIDCFRDLPVVSYTKREGLSSDEPNSVYAAEDGTVWVGLVNGLDPIRNGVVSPIRTGQALPGSEVSTMLVDRTGHLWVGVDDGLYLYDKGHFQPILDTRRNRSGVLTALAEDADGSIWAVAQTPTRRLLHIRRYVIAEQFPTEEMSAVIADPHGGIWLNLLNTIAYRQKDGVQKLLRIPEAIRIDYISDVILDNRGVLWASLSQGVLRSDGESTQLLGESNGLPCASHGNLIFDNQGSLWLTQKCGIVRIDRHSLDNWVQHPQAWVSPFLLDVFDGVQVGHSDFYPGVSRGRDGRLWFVNGSMDQMIDPAHLHINTHPPPVHIEQLMAGHKDMAITSAIYLAPLTRDIEIDYTALSFVMPQRVRFRYKLEGHDREWQDSGTRRSAFYTNLRPGIYKFRVIACNNSNVWNSQGAALSFVILPAWYQTMSFRLFVPVFLVLLAYAFYLLRMRQYAAAMRERSNERLNERLRIARELHDTLLQSFHGLMFQFQAARNLLPRRPESAMQTLDEAILATEQALTEGRDAIHDLRPEPATRHDLEELLTAVGQEMADAREANRHLPSFRVIVEGKPERLSPTIENEIYRIAREVIRNAFHHAVASHIEVEIRYDERELRLRIRDDGKGIDHKVLEASGRPGHWGLPGIRERAQRIGLRLDFWIESGAGTEVELRVPAAIAYEKQRDGHRFRLFRKGEIDGRRS
jgi:signal transduction histidine kinase/ligand-binding sensor domain-containing protein